MERVSKMSTGSVHGRPFTLHVNTGVHGVKSVVREYAQYTASRVACHFGHRVDGPFTLLQCKNL